MSDSPAVVVMAQLKGGAGKTTTAVALASTLHRSFDIRVLLIDADEKQHSALEWFSAGVDERGDEHGLPTVVGATAATIRSTVLDYGARYEIVIIDTPGRLASETRRALLTAGDFGGVALMPLQPSGFDLRALPKTLDLVKEAQDYRPELRCALVRNQWDPRLRVTQDIQATIEDLDGVPIVAATLGDRTAYAAAATHGLALADAGDPKALAETEALAREIFGLDE